MQFWQSHLVLLLIVSVRSSSFDSWVTRSPMVSSLCWDLRHLTYGLYSLCLVPRVLPMWCQVGRFILCSRDSLGASRDRLYFAPVLRVSWILLGSVLEVYLFLM